MLSARVGSFAWLLRHDMRLNWRQFTAMFARTSRRASWLLGLAAVAALHGLALAGFDHVRPIMAADPTHSSALLIGTVFVLAWMMSQGLIGTSRMLYDRGDLDLLLASPLPGRRVFAARAISLSAGSFGSAAILILPAAHVGALIEGPAWLSIHVVLGAYALLGTAIGAAIAFALFFTVGPRRARLYSSITAAMLAGTFVLSVQAAALLPVEMRAALSERAAGLGLLEAAWLPVAAARGDGMALLALVSFSLAIFAAAALMLGPAFAAASAAAGDGPVTDRTATAAAARPPVFRSGLAASLRRKEWRLLLRDPNLFAQLALQIIYTLPVAVVLLNSSSNVPTQLGLAPVIVVIATQIAASLAWVVVSAEDAPELIAAAPVTQGAVDRAKLSAIAWPVIVVIAAPLAGLALISWPAALLAAAFAAAGATSTALLNLWHPMPGKRRGMLRRHSQSKLVAMVEHLLALLWAVAVVLAMFQSAAVVLPVVIVVCVLMICRRSWISGPAKAKSRQVARAQATG